MTVIFDKENAISFFKNIDDSEIGDDILKLLKKQTNLQFNFELDDEEEALEFQIQEFIEAGGRKKHQLSINFKKSLHWEKHFCIDDIISNNDVYLIHGVTDKVGEANKVLIGDVGDEINVLQKLFLDIEDLSVHENMLIGKGDFQSWEDIHVYNRPFSSMTIVDRYMFKGPEIGGNLGLFEYNLKKLLGTFYKNQKQKTNLTFIYQINPFVSQASRSYDEGPDIQRLKQKIKAAVRSYNKYCPTPDVNFIGVPKGKILDEHDRHIITNYLRIKSGDTLVYFDSAGNKITTSNEFDIYSLARKRYRDTTLSLVSKLNDIVNETIEKYEDRCFLHDSSIKKNIINF